MKPSASRFQIPATILLLAASVPGRLHAAGRRYDQEFNLPSAFPRGFHHVTDCTLSAVELLAYPALEEAVLSGAIPEKKGGAARVAASPWQGDREVVRGLRGMAQRIRT